MKGIKIRNAKITSSTSQAFGRYLNEIQAIPLLTVEEERTIALNGFAGDKAAKDKLVRHNLRFVISVANMYCNDANPLEELVAVGNLGLVKAAEEFNPDKGVKFISFAVWRIRGGILNHIKAYGRTIRIPINQLEKITKLNKLTLQLEQELERKPQPEELVESFDAEVTIRPHKSKKFTRQEVATKEYNFLTEAFKAIPESTSNSISYDDDYTIGENLVNDTFINIDELIIQDEFKARIHQHIDKLKPKEKRLIELVYGLDSGEPKSFTEVAEIYKTKRQNIYDKHSKILKKLKEIITTDIYN